MDNPSSIRFGTKNIIYGVNLSSDGSYYLKYNYGSPSDFSETDQKMVFYGTPLSLEYAIWDNKRVYAIKVIESTFGYPLTSNEYSCVFQGSRLALIEDQNGSLYLKTENQSETPVISDETMVYGVPLALGSNQELIFINSGFFHDLDNPSLSDVEETSYISIGGSPVMIGRISNEWMLIIERP